MIKRAKKDEANLIAARGAAFRLWKDLNHPHPREVPLEDLAMSLGVLVTDGELEGAEGRLIRKASHGIIRVRSGINYTGRRRFTIAHELGHWKLHDDVSQFLCVEEDMRDYGRSPMEMEANCFASELLMPTGHFREFCSHQLPSLQLIESLAKDFETTLTATAIRFTDLSKYRIIVVWTFGGIVRWSYSNPQHHLPFVMPGKSPPEFSSATLPVDELGDQFEYFDQANWFPELSSTAEVLEVTKRMPRLKAGLTLLYFP